MLSHKGTRLVLLLGIAVTLIAGVVRVAAAPLLSTEPPSQSVLLGRIFPWMSRLPGSLISTPFSSIWRFIPPCCRQ